jgi:hypothetical protein
MRNPQVFSKICHIGRKKHEKPLAFPKIYHLEKKIMETP